MKTSKYLESQIGMTLVEVMVSVFLVTLLAGAVSGLLIQNVKMGKTLDYNYVAVNIAKGRMDRVRELRRDQGFDNLNTAAETDTLVDRNGLPDSGGEFTRTTTITTDFGGNANLTKVEVLISYKGSRDISTTTITLTSLLSPYI